MEAGEPSLSKRAERRASVGMEGMVGIRVNTIHLLCQEERRWMGG